MNRLALLAPLSVILACKGTEGGTPAVDAAPSATATASASAADTASATVDAAPAPTLPQPSATAVAPKKHVAGVKKAGAAAAEQCCCKVGRKHSFAGQSECAKELSGACVAMTECDTRSCCCKSDAITVTRLMSACADDHGTCVKKEQCQ